MDEFTPFLFSGGLVLAIVALEAIAFFIGFSLSEAVDSALGLDLDLDLDTTTTGRVLDWFCLGKLPALIVLVLAMAVFTAIGVALQLVFGPMHAALAVAVSLVTAMPIVHWSGRALAALVPQIETSAVTRSDLIGCSGFITIGTAKAGSPAQAKITDVNGYLHLVMVEPDDPESAFEAGQEVLLTGALSTGKYSCKPAPERFRII